jgi:ABC-2 type transport system permease protein/fluoroquinolone transport system permease protein
MKKLWTLLKIDYTMALRGKFILLTIILAILLTVIINFVLPEKLTTEMSTYILDKTRYGGISAVLNAQGDEGNAFKIEVTKSEEELTSKLTKSNGVGVIFEDDRVIIVKQGYEDEAALNLMTATLNLLTRKLAGVYSPASFKYTVLEPQSTEKLPFNKSMIPALIVLDVFLLGFYLIAAMIFQDKKEGIINAYRISPINIFGYIVSKVVINSSLSIALALIIIATTVGFQMNYLHYFVIVTLSALLFSSLGMLLSQFYSSLTEFMYISVAFILIIAIPVISYFQPSFSVPFFRYIPSYPVMFEIKNIISSVQSKEIWSLSLLLAAELAGVLVLVYFTSKRVLFGRRHSS